MLSRKKDVSVVICWKIRIFAYWTTPGFAHRSYAQTLWFAEKFVSLLIEQHRAQLCDNSAVGCDLLKNSYLCLLNNTQYFQKCENLAVVICWKIRIFAYWTTPNKQIIQQGRSCDLLKNSYLCLLNNTLEDYYTHFAHVVICWKIRIFAYWTTPLVIRIGISNMLWFAEKFVSLLIEQHRGSYKAGRPRSCDLLKNSYLCLLNNTLGYQNRYLEYVVICWKIRIFAYWTTPWQLQSRKTTQLWFAEKFVSLLIEQHPASRSSSTR